MDGQTDIWKFPLVSYSTSAFKGRCLKRKVGLEGKKERRKAVREKWQEGMSKWKEKGGWEE